jgi:hypothetical protein
MNYGLEQYFPNVISNIIFNYSGNTKYDEAVKELKNIFNYTERSTRENQYGIIYKITESFFNTNNMPISENIQQVYKINNGCYNLHLFKHYIKIHQLTHDIKLMCRRKYTSACDCGNCSDYEFLSDYEIDENDECMFNESD